MSVVINTNVDSIRIQHDLTKATNKMSTAMERMSTGLKVLGAKDDAAGTVIAARMQVQLEGNKICQNNVQNANAMLATAEGNLEVIQDNLSRIRDLTLQAKNGTYSKEEKQAMQDEVAERIKEIDRISISSKYSQMSLFEDTELNKDDAAGIKLQVGANYGDENTVLAEASLFKSVQFSALTGQAYSTLDDAKIKAGNTKLGYEFNIAEMSNDELNTALENLDKAIDNITGRKSIIGSAENRLSSALNALNIQETNLSEAKSVITDADVANEASSFTSSSILQQVAVSLLAQANQAPGVALSLV